MRLQLLGRLFSNLDCPKCPFFGPKMLCFGLKCIICYHIVLYCIALFFIALLGIYFVTLCICYLLYGIALYDLVSYVIYIACFCVFRFVAQAVSRKTPIPSIHILLQNMLHIFSSNRGNNKCQLIFTNNRRSASVYQFSSQKKKLSLKQWLPYTDVTRRLFRYL